MANDMDFIGFTYNGKHSYTDFRIYRTSDGSRYNDNLIPNITDKTADVPGGDGQYFFKTNYKTRQFSVSIAFDDLKEEEYGEMRRWLDGQAIHDLIFDELPYKVYSAKVTGTPQLKTICFEEEGQRVYKGEGTIQFTCYYPFAHTPNTEKPNGFDGRSLSNYNQSNKSQWATASKLSTHSDGNNPGDLPAPFIATKNSIPANTTLKVADCEIVIKEACSNFKWDSKTGLVTGKVDSETKARPIKYTGKSYGTIPVGGTTNISLNGATLKYDYWYY